MSYKFMKISDIQNSPSATNVTVEVSDDVTYDVLLGHFEDFLRGCGYIFPGHVTIVEEEQE